MLPIIAKEYAPYNTMREFTEGYNAYQVGNYTNPHDGVKAQAWDRGLECAMRAARWRDSNVGND